MQQLERLGRMVASTMTSPRLRRTRSRADAPLKSIAVIGDVVRSRRLAGPARQQVQVGLEQLTAAINQRYRRAIGARFLVTLGDEFQGVLKQAEILPDLIWHIERSLRNAEVRIGIGFGTLNPPFKPIALGMDGSAFHAARKAIELARKDRLQGGLFVGFGETDDLVLNGFARLLRFVRQRLTKAQVHVLTLLREGHTQTQIAKELRISRQAVSKSAKGVGSEAYLEGERAWAAALKPFDVSEDWERRSR
jgi:hypothetical protein